MNSVSDFLVKMSKRDNSVMVRTVATILGAILFWILIPAFVAWVGIVFMNSPILPIFPARIFAVIFFVFGVPWMVWAIVWQLIIGKGTPVPVVPTKNFLNNGPYHFSRNPMMTGFFLYLVGFALWWNQWGSLLATIGLIALLCVEIKRIEEPELTKRFGDAYKEYKKETPFILPRIRF